ncbi:MAG: DUF5050 domain-containing protein [Candidatus Cloacimonetes bacterium]|nr:DUF5050 domain-containing protein [Candidatus Cloacimonadota bacterium]
MKKKNNKFLIISLLFITFFLAGCDILFYHESNDIYKDCIYLIDTNGSNLTKVIDLGHTDDSIMGGSGSDLPGAENIQFTPDGEKLIYFNVEGPYGDKDYKLYSINIDGSDNTLLTDTLIVWGQPSISLTEPKIVFSAYNGKFLDIFTVNWDATGLKNLTNTSEVNEKYPYFSPNGDEIIFTNDFNDNSLICKLNICSENIDTLTISEDYKYDLLAFSPNGEKIYYIKHRELFLMDSDGTNQAKLLDDIRSSLSFSSDGSMIVYNDYWNLYIMNSDGSEITQIDTVSLPRYPNISHNGANIIYSHGHISGDIYIIDSDGGNKREIYRGFKPMFSPEGSKIAFAGYYFYKTIYSN